MAKRRTSVEQGGESQPESKPNTRASTQRLASIRHAQRKRVVGSTLTRRKFGGRRVEDATTYFGSPEEEAYKWAQHWEWEHRDD